MIITQRYSLHHAILYWVHLLGKRTFRKKGEIGVGDSCARKRVEYRVYHQSTVIRVKHCFKNG